MNGNPGELVRFVLTGVLNTVVGFGIYTGLVLLGLESALALLMATIIGMLFNFFSFGSLTFRRLDARRLPRFLFAYTGIYLLNVALLWGIQNALGAGPIAAQFLCLFIVAPVAYLTLKSKVFGD